MAWPKGKPLTEAQILAWANEHHDRTGRWPSAKSGTVLGAPGEKWWNIEQALYAGVRGLPGGDSLAKLLDRRRRGQPMVPPRRRGRSWLSEEDELVRTLPPQEAAERTGRTLRAVYERRNVLRMPDGRRAARRWQPARTTGEGAGCRGDDCLCRWNRTSPGPRPTTSRPADGPPTGAAPAAGAGPVVSQTSSPDPQAGQAATTR
jgi:hypothetical protein